jgi:hypothetical protein
MNAQQQSKGGTATVGGGGRALDLAIHLHG